MEKSHYQARTKFFKNTRHGGGANKANSLLEVFQWFYRQIWHRTRSHKAKNSIQNLQVVAALQRKKQERQVKYRSSSASEKFLQWLASREREGRKWRKL